MALIKDKKQLDGLIRISFINANTNLPDFEYAEQLHLVPYIGKELYDDMQALANEEAAEGEPTDDERRDLQLLQYCRRVVAPMAYLMELPMLHVRMNDTGLHTVSSDNFQSAHRWEYEEVKEYLVSRGTQAIESLLQFLFEQKEHYQDWTDSDAYKEATSLVFTTGSEFNKYFSLQQPHRLFWELRPLIREVEDFYINPTIGEEYFTTLKGKEDPTSEEKAAITIIKKIVAQKTIVKAIEKLSCRMTSKGFTILLSAGNSDAVNAGTSEAKDNQLSLLFTSCDRSGDDYLLMLQDYMNTNATAEKLADYFNSSYYKKPAQNNCDKSPNHGLRIFGM